MIRTRKSGRAEIALRSRSETAGRFADACRADDGEMAGKGLVDRDTGVDSIVLGKLTDGDGAASGKVVDRLQVAAAYAMGDGADIGIGGDAAVEHRVLVGAHVTNLSDQLDINLDGVVAFAAPRAVGLGDGIDQADGAGFAEIDADHAADGPQADCGRGSLCIGADDRAGTIALHDMAKDTGVVLFRVAPLLRGGFSALGLTFEVHRSNSPKSGQENSAAQLRWGDG
jgi:hypothetical protein